MITIHSIQILFVKLTQKINSIFLLKSSPTNKSTGMEYQVGEQERQPKKLGFFKITYLIDIKIIIKSFSFCYLEWAA